MSAEPLIARLSTAKKQGLNSWRAKCPAHDGTSNSGLKITDCDDGRVLIHCFGGCSVQDVLNSVGMTYADVMPDGMRSKERSPEDNKFFRAWAALQAIPKELVMLQILAGDLRKGKPPTEETRKLAGRAYRVLQDALDHVEGATNNAKAKSRCRREAA